MTYADSTEILDALFSLPSPGASVSALLKTLRSWSPADADAVLEEIDDGSTPLWEAAEIVFERASEVAEILFS